MRNAVADTDRILLDYNLQVGDTFRAGVNAIVVTSIDSTLIHGIWHRVWKFPFFGGGGWYTGVLDSIYIVEGIGCLEGPTFHLQDWSSCVECMQPYMYCFSHKGNNPLLAPTVAWLDNNRSCSYYPTLDIETLHSNKSPILYPQPTHDVLAIDHTEEIKTITITDLAGQKWIQTNNDSNHVILNVTTLVPGTYLVFINRNTVMRFVKE